MFTVHIFFPFLLFENLIQILLTPPSSVMKINCIPTCKQPFTYKITTRGKVFSHYPLTPPYLRRGLCGGLQLAARQASSG